MRKKDVVGTVTFDPPITLLLILQWHTGVCEETFDVKRRTIFEISLSESRIYKKWQTSAIIREISDSNLETRRNGSKSGLSQIIRESRQPCKLSLYYTLIYPYLSYCNIVWSSTYNTHLNRIFILQKSAIHALSKSEYHAHTAPLLLNPRF